MTDTNTTMTRERKDPRDRGLFQRPHGSGIWWICYFDRQGKRHREKIGPSKATARDIYKQRRTEIRLEKFDPEAVARRKRPALLAEAINGT